MKKLYLLVILAAAEITFAQTTLTGSANQPSVGNSYSGNAVTGTVDNSATGAGATFSNPTLTAGGVVTTTFTAPTALEITTFPGSNLKQEDGSGTSFLFKSSTNKIEITGLTNPTATFNFSADNGTYLAYPVAFSYSNTDNARGTFTSTLLSGLFRGTVVGTSGASGTLVIGSNTYPNVLRVKIVQNYNLYQSTDTLYLFAIGNITTTTYQYYDNVQKFPLLTDTTGVLTVPLAGINQTDNFAVAQSIVFLGSKEATTLQQFSVYPNPVADVLKFKGLTKKDQNVKIYSVDGKLINQQKINADEINVSSLSSGNYFITVGGAEAQSRSVKVIKK